MMQYDKLATLSAALDRKAVRLQEKCAVDVCGGEQGEDSRYHGASVGVRGPALHLHRPPRLYRGPGQSGQA